jgi:hypothetical protein
VSEFAQNERGRYNNSATFAGSRAVTKPEKVIQVEYSGKEDLMVSDSPRGIWEITDEGKQWLTTQMG